MESFLDALDEHHAWEFARRPLDVAELVAFWAHHGRLGSLTELIEFDLERKLREMPQRPDLLSPERSREGAETLGAATAFCREFNFRVPDDLPVEKGMAVDTTACLPADWQPEWGRALLQRAVFDSAAYGRIRFHHRRIAEYLAKCWLEKRMAHNCAYQTLEELLFARPGGRWVLRPGLAPITAWLLCGEEPWRQDLRMRVRQTAPGLPLLYGDPACLSCSYKKELLEELVTKYKDRSRVWLSTDPENLSRIAEPGVADAVAGIIVNRTVADDIRADLLRLINHGRLTDCLDAALVLMADPEESSYLKSYVAAAVRDVGEDSHRRRLAEIAADFIMIPATLCAHICEGVLPSAMGVDGLIALLEKSEDVPPRSIGLPYYLARHLEDTAGQYDAATLLAHILELAQRLPHITHGVNTVSISNHFYWLDCVIPVVLKALLDSPELDAKEASVAAKALWLLGLMRHHCDSQIDLPEDFDATVARHPAVRQSYFWRLVNMWRKDEPGKQPNLFQIFGYWEIVKRKPADLDWLLVDMRERTASEDRLLAMKYAIECWEQRGRNWSGFLNIWRSAASDSDLRQSLLKDQAIRPQAPLRRFWYRNITYKLGQGWWWDQRAYRLRHFGSWIREQSLLLRHIRELSKGERTVWLSQLVTEAAEGAHEHWAPIGLSGLRKKRGRLIAWAAERGCKRTWSRFRPLLPHEKSEPLQTDHRVIVGLAGLQAAYQEGELDFEQFTKDEARVAACYAVNELNGFAPWLKELADCQPLAVREMFAACVRGEWEFPPEREYVSEVLHDLVWHGEGLVHLVLDDMLNTLRTRDPKHTNILRYALQILVRTAAPPLDALAELAAQRVNDYRSDEPSYMLWLSVWIQADAEPALALIARMLEREDDADGVMMRLCSALDTRHGREGPLLQEPGYMQPAALSILIPLVYKQIRPVDDIDRAGGGVYSPTARDDAQAFRDSLLERLAGSPDPEADSVLEGLLGDPVFEEQWDWILYLIERRTERLADLPPWTPSDIRNFAIDFETTPKSDFDLFRIACRRLEKIRHSVEAADISTRDELHKRDDESRLRSWLARKLRDSAQGCYTVPQEVEIDRGKRPDLRVEFPDFVPVPIEIKWAEKWSLANLTERLENQLVGQYLKPHDARYGIYLLGYIDPGAKQYWIEPKSRRRLSFGQVVSYFQERADEIVLARPDIYEIKITGIDFTS